MPRAEWRSRAAYEDLRTHDAPGFAWEFLSRNPAFEHDRKRLEQASEDRPLSDDELNSFARRWGGAISRSPLRTATFIILFGRRRACRA